MEEAVSDASQPSVSRGVTMPIADRHLAPTKAQAQPAGRDAFGGIAIQDDEPDEFGGVALDTDEFGGVTIETDDFGGEAIPATVAERAVNAAVALPQGLATSVGQSISGAARTVDTVREGIALTSQPLGTARPTGLQRRKAFEQAMNDPRYMAALSEAGDDERLLGKAESLFGPAAKLSLLRAPIEAARTGAAEESLAQQARLETNPVYRYGQDYTAAAKEVYPTNPYLDTKVESKVTRALGSTVPTVALGLVPGVGLPTAVTQYALSQSEDMAQEAIEAGRPELATQAATAGLFIGAISEASLGATARLKSIIANPTRLAALEGWAAANPIKAAGLVASLRESTQEGVEQALQNLTASDLVGYDPERPWHQHVLEAAGLGAVTGGLLGGGGALVQQAGQPAPTAEPAPDRTELDAALLDLQPAAETPAAAPVQTSAPAPGELLPTFEPERLTPEQVMAREASAAMAELRALKAGRAVAAAPPHLNLEPEILNQPEPFKESLEPSVGDLNAVPPLAVEARPTADASPPSSSRRKATLGPRPDGIPDLLDAIQQLGGIRAPGSQAGTAEYDGYAAAFNQGPAAVLRGGTNRPDLLLQALEEYGYRFESPDQMYDAVQRAGAARTAAQQQAKAERTLRPEMVERVQSLYDSAVAGHPVTSEQLMEVESQLNERELRTLKTSLVKLRTLADVAQPVEGEPNAIAAAKAEVRQAWNEFTPTTAVTMGGILPNPQEDARKVFNLYKALFKLAAAYAKQGVKTAAEFAEKIGVKLTAVVQAAWDDALAGQAKTSPLQLDPTAVNEQVDGFKERKFSRRFDEDERMAPELRAATGNATYLPIGNELTVTQAFGIIQEQGLDAAIAQMKDERNRALSDRERVALGQAIVTKLNHEYAQTKNEAALDKAVDVAEWLTEYGTKLGQGVQAFAIWSRLTPDGYVRAYVKAVSESNRKARQGRAGAAAPPTSADPATKKKIHAAATEALKKPAGFQRDEALVDVLATIARAKGISKMDVGLGLWYANILSGWTTQVRNLAGNVSNLLFETFTHGATRPQHIPGMLAGLYNGILRGALEGGRILRTGKVTGTRVGKVEAPAALELIKFKGAAYPLNAWKYVFRVMAATDMTFFRSAEEMKARFLAREIVRKEGLTGNAGAKRLAELLHNAPAQRAAAEAQATQEGLTGGAKVRRVAEIMEQGRPPDLVQGAADYGRFATFNQDPQGVLGVLSSGIAGMSQRFAPLRLVVPFTRVVANVTNNALNFTPWGYRRLFPSAFMDENWMKPDAAPVDYQLQAARATLGTVGLVALYALAVQYRDDDDPPFMLTANGPQDPDHRKQLRETGWEPYTVKMGDRYWSYRETPLHLVMATLGSLLDAQRYKKLDEADALTRYAYAARQIGTAPLNQSFLRSLSEFFEGLSDDRVPKSGAKFGGLSRTASSLVIPNLVKQVDRLFDPTVYDAGTVQGALVRDIPVARRGLDPALNILGEPIKADQNPFYSLERPDPLWQLIGRRQLWIPTPSRTMMVGDRPITPEEYRALIETRGKWLSGQLRRPETLQLLATRPAEQAQQYIARYADQATQHARSRLKLRPASPGR